MTRIATNEADPKGFLKVQQKTINPKSIKKNQLYGNLDENTAEWTDGVLAIIVRDFAESESPDRKWVMFDGPVDAVWIENMNTVLDDNKKLCLNSGAVIKLSNVMTMLFEVDDLSFASPATVSRCGMVFLEPHQLGHTVLITSYLNNYKENFSEKLLAKIVAEFHFLADMSVLFSLKHLKYPQTTGPNYLVDNMIKLFDTFMKDWLV
jgi:dynein heavy chain